MRALVVNGQSILLMTWSLRPDNTVEPVRHQTEQNEVHVPTANDGEHLFALITAKFSAKITYTHGILTPGDFHPDRSGGHVVSSWKSPDITVSVSSGENNPTLWLVWVWGENHLTLWLKLLLQLALDASRGGASPQKIRETRAWRTFA